MLKIGVFEGSEPINLSKSNMPKVPRCSITNALMGSDPFHTRRLTPSSTNEGR